MKTIFFILDSIILIELSLKLLFDIVDEPDKLVELEELDELVLFTLLNDNKDLCTHPFLLLETSFIKAHFPFSFQ